MNVAICTRTAVPNPAARRWQRARCVQLAEQLGLEVTHEYHDDGKSRPTLDPLLPEILAGGVSTPIVASIDRRAPTRVSNSSTLGGVAPWRVGISHYGDAMDTATTTTDRADELLPSRPAKEAMSEIAGMSVFATFAAFVLLAFPSETALPHLVEVAPVAGAEALAHIGWGFGV